MTRTGTTIGILIFALFLVAASPPANAQAGETTVEWDINPDPPTPPWIAEAGDETEANVAVQLCWEDLAVNLQEGNAEVTMTLPSDTPELSIRFDNDEDSEFVLELPQQTLGPQDDEGPECTRTETVGVFIDLREEFDAYPHTHEFELTFTAEGSADTGTFVLPDDITVIMEVVIDEPEEVPGSGSTENDTETETTPPENNDSPAPALAVFTVLALALLAVIRRRV